MTVNITNQSPYLRNSREFSGDLDAVTIELDKMYIDVAQFVNLRTIGIFPTNKYAFTGESWFINSNKKQQTLRQTYTFTTTGSINTGLTTLPTISRAFGSYTDGTGAQYGLIFGSETAIAGNLSFYLLQTGNVVTIEIIGAHAVTSGIVVIEWLSQP